MKYFYNTETGKFYKMGVLKDETGYSYTMTAIPEQICDYGEEKIPYWTGSAWELRDE
tara:strand:+ start:375 stop:545 length:171 start_codon:yes stop_codon:yes gene_type:complete